MHDIVEFLFPTQTRWYDAVLLVGLTVALAWRLRAAPRRDVVAAPPLTVPEIASIRSREAPLLAVMGRLRAGGHLDAWGKVDAQEPLPDDTDDYTRHMLPRLSGSTRKFETLAADNEDALLDLESAVTDRGYVRTADEARRVRASAYPLVAVSVIGVVGVPVEVLGLHVPLTQAIVGLLVPAAVVALVARRGSSTVRRTTRAGKRLLAEERARMAYLAPNAGPSFATYGAPAVGLSIALFGTAALWKADRRYAESRAVPPAGRRQNRPWRSRFHDAGEFYDGGTCGGGFSGGGHGGGCGGSNP